MKENKEYNKIVKKDRKTDFLGVFRNFLKAKSLPVSQEEEIQASNETEKTKQDLEKALKRAEKMEEMFRQSVRVQVVGGLEQTTKQKSKSNNQEQNQSKLKSKNKQSEIELEH